MARILSAMSGGVDSSVATALLAREGHEVVGVSLQLSDESAGGAVSRCCSSADIRDARLVAGKLGIPHYVFNEENAFEAEVRAPFAEGYASGRTPNPCVRCNSRLKFGSLLRIARALGAERIATGHYARISADPRCGVRRLRRGRDAGKDQSYFLHDLDDEQIDAALFPVGELAKEDVCALAAAFDLPVAGKGESQDLCFIPGGDTRAWLRARIGAGRPGEIMDSSGRVLGRHDGVHGFTIGQRRGLGISSPRALYVLATDSGSGEVRVGPAEDLDAEGLVAGEVRLRGPRRDMGPFRAKAQIRSRHAAAPATVRPLAGNRIEVRFDRPQRAVTPGQAVVLYDDEIVLGGGWIEASGLDSSPEPPVAWCVTEAGRA